MSGEVAPEPRRMDFEDSKEEVRMCEDSSKVHKPQREKCMETENSVVSETASPTRSFKCTELDHEPVVIETLHAPGSRKVSTESPSERKRKLSSDDESQVVENIDPDKLQANPIVQCISKPGKIFKKPQMKYDPDIPMSKQEAAIWRREQRRKRNRESAAASRQRQRDRIQELEAEVEQWKIQYDRIMHQVRELEQMTGARHGSPDYMAQEVYHHSSAHHHPHMMMHYHVPPRTSKHEVMCHHHGPTTPTHYRSKHAAAVSPAADGHASFPPRNTHHYAHIYYRPASVSPHPSPRDRDDSSSDEQEEYNHEYYHTGKRHEYQHSTKISSRQAVKITDADTPSFPATSSVHSPLPPEMCVSETAKLEPMEQALLEEAAEHVLLVAARESPTHEDFGEFFMGPSDWA